MKGFFAEFKKFITRGNVLDMSVGVIVGGAFTAIVNGMSNFVLKPIINWVLALIFGSNSLSDIYTYLKFTPKLDEAGKVVVNDLGAPVADLANSIYIDWGAFINAIINFLLIAFVLFSIVKFMNKMKEGNSKLKGGVGKLYLDKNERKELKAAGIKLSDREAIKAFYEEKEKKEAEEKAKAEAEAKRIADEKAAAERLANPTTEDLLKQIKALLESNLQK